MTLKERIIQELQNTGVTNIEKIFQYTYSLFVQKIRIKKVASVKSEIP